MAEESIQALPALKDAYFKEQLLDMFNFNLLYGSEQMLNRTMVEFFRAFPRLCDYHRTVMENVKKKVMDVAYKWLNIIRQSPAEGLHGEAFLQRVQRSADYFAAALKELIPDLLEKTKMVNGKNKMGMEQLDERFKDFYLQYLSKEKMLDAMAEVPFTVAAYLQNKQEALVDAMDTIDPAGRQARLRTRRTSDNPYDNPRVGQDNGSQKTSDARKAQKEKAQKEPKKTQKKGESAELSLTMFNQGLSIEQIAQQRELAASTILGHLAEEHAPVDDILAKCPKDIKKEEVYFMLNSMK